MVNALLILAVAGSSLPTWGDIVIERDLRAKNSKSSLTVVLCARQGIPGHAMVVLGKEDDVKKVSSINAFGFYPAEGKGLFGTVPGKIADEFVEGKGVATATVRIIVRVDKPLYDKVEVIRAHWAKKKDYKVFESDCVSFVMEVAKALGLKVPARTNDMLPSAFVELLVNHNK